MHRRSFFARAAGLGAIPLFSQEVQAQAKSANLKITAVELWQATGDSKRYDAYLDEEYPKGGMVRPSPPPGQRPAAPAPPSRIYMKILTDGGLEGFYGPHDQNVVDEVVKIRSVVGMDPFAIDSVWESLVTGDNRYTGTYMFGVSAITNTLWDMKGKLCNLPVYRLLGGSRKAVDCYATTIGMPVNTIDAIAEGAARVKKAGFKAQKWFPTLGPRDGAEGFEFNVTMMKTLREVCGENYDIMIDGLTRWDLPYGMRWCKAVEQYRPRWLEEPFQTYSQIETLARLRQMTTIPIATGEHNYNRWEFYELVKAGAVDILEPDTEWCGGISEVTRICALASAAGLKVSPHHMKLNALAHLVASQPPAVCPVVENRHSMYIGTKYFEKNPIGHNGSSQIELSDRPGFGIELDDSKIVSMKKIFPAA
jgi:L-alanine-DL-glutamate epimerase-like enolase superfamily enzyme